MRAHENPNVAEVWTLHSNFKSLGTIIGRRFQTSESSNYCTSVIQQGPPICNGQDQDYHQGHEYTQIR